MYDLVPSRADIGGKLTAKGMVYARYRPTNRN